MVCLWKILAFGFIVLILIQNQGANPVRIRIRILFRLLHHIRLDFNKKNTQVICRKSSLREYKSHFERLEIRFMC
jgi:hypothetical protein